jgi:hypothetical protein
MAAFDVSLDARLLQAEGVQVARVDGDAVREPEREEEQALQSPQPRALTRRRANVL